MFEVETTPKHWSDEETCENPSLKSSGYWLRNRYVLNHPSMTYHERITGEAESDENPTPTSHTTAPETTDDNSEEEENEQESNTDITSSSSDIHLSRSESKPTYADVVKNFLYIKMRPHYATRQKLLGICR